MVRGKLALLAVAGSAAVAVISFSLATTGETQAAGSLQSTFIVPANDGYGVGDCVGSGGACGKVVADSWCEAQGFSRAETFGLADVTDVTGAIPARKPERPISITCAD